MAICGFGLHVCTDRNSRCAVFCKLLGVIEIKFNTTPEKIGPKVQKKFKN